MEENRKKINWSETLILALGIALLPPIWAVLSPSLGIETGSVALICAGLYVANGSNSKEAVKISVGFLCGDIWAVTVIWASSMFDWNERLELFVLLSVLGALAVLLAGYFSSLIHLPAWLCGWAIGLTIMGKLSPSEIGTLPLQIGTAMLVGVWYVGVGTDLFTKSIRRFLDQK